MPFPFFCADHAFRIQNVLKRPQKYHVSSSKSGDRLYESSKAQQNFISAVGPDEDDEDALACCGRPQGLEMERWIVGLALEGSKSARAGLDTGC